MPERKREKKKCYKGGLAKGWKGIFIKGRKKIVKGSVRVRGRKLIYRRLIREDSFKKEFKGFKREGFYLGWRE